MKIRNVILGLAAVMICTICFFAISVIIRDYFMNDIYCYITIAVLFLFAVIIYSLIKKKVNYLLLLVSITLIINMAFASCAYFFRPIEKITISSNNNYAIIKKVSFPTNKLIVQEKAFWIFCKPIGNIIVPKNYNLNDDSVKWVDESKAIITVQYENNDAQYLIDFEKDSINEK